MATYEWNDHCWNADRSGATQLCTACRESRVERMGKELDDFLTPKEFQDLVAGPSDMVTWTPYELYVSDLVRTTREGAEELAPLAEELHERKAEVARLRDEVLAERPKSGANAKESFDPREFMVSNKLKESDMAKRAKAIRESRERLQVLEFQLSIAKREATRAENRLAYETRLLLHQGRKKDKAGYLFGRKRPKKKQTK